jgi:hypothetical protein
MEKAIKPHHNHPGQAEGSSDCDNKLLKTMEPTQYEIKITGSGTPEEIRTALQMIIVELFSTSFAAEVAEQGVMELEDFTLVTHINEYNPEKDEEGFGIDDISGIPLEDLVKCNNCDKYYYEEPGDERDDNCLQVFEDKKGTAEMKANGIPDREFFRGCPKCETDGYLTNVEQP